MRATPHIAKSLMLGALSCLLLGNAAFGAFRAGAAVRDVTPPKLLPVSGGMGPSQPVTRQIGRLTVRALVIENDGTRVAICSTDFLGFPGVLCDKVRRQVKGIAAENILIGATHNHSGPDCYGFPDASGRTACHTEYLDDVCAKLAEAINEAADRVQTARVKIATGPGSRQDRLQRLRGETVRPSLRRHPVLERRVHAHRHSRELRLSSRSDRSTPGNLLSRFRRPVV